MKTIGLQDFYKLMNEMAEVWPSINAPARLKRYYATISDLELDVVKAICNDFMDRFSKMPLPADFLAASNIFKRMFFEKYNYYYGKENTKFIDIPHKVDCEDCYDTGLNYISVENFPTFCFCECSNGKEQEKNSKWILPNWSEIKNKYNCKKSTYPKDIFKPSKERDLSLFTDNKKNNQVLKYEQLNNEAQDFWKEFHNQKYQQRELK